MPKRRSDTPEEKESSKVTKQEPTRRSERLSVKPVAPRPEVKPKKAEKAVVKKPNPNPVEEKPVGKAKKAVAKGKTDAGVAQNGQVKNEIYVCRPSVSVTFTRTRASSMMSVRGQSETVRVQGNRRSRERY
ncbi:high mobility group nucleosome-binding domain-containing protein 3 isoform X1 [Gadus morhua]|uniref:high mobility group nucleosome-binding domain-containing protein 3 isoform X1 n=1 Tax=Gadus morhua TaxID=8049 RepID=UPI0011B6D972|nr:high mobility group nucleosome-binding domain-containing protein 3 isoform X1 [Gadus morhua]